LSRHSHALDDFDTVLSLTMETGASFDKAYLMKGKIFAKEGRWPEARDMLKHYSGKVKGDQVAGDLLFAVSEGEVASKKAAQFQKSNSYPDCVSQATLALTTANHSPDLRRLRADCSLASGDLESAAADLTRLTHILPPSTALYSHIANLTYFLLPPSVQAQAILKQCLHSDPDSKLCSSSHRLFKSLEKTFTKLNGLVEAKNWGGVIDLVEKRDAFAAQFDDTLKVATANLDLPQQIDPLKTSVKRKTVWASLCTAYLETKQVRKGEPWCEEVLKMDDGNTDALVARGELKLLNEEWEEAVRAFEKAWEAGGRQGGEIHQKLQRAQKLLKQSRAKDYYKVLGVARDADKQAIKKAYRKAAMTAHPDKGGSEAKMAAVNEAYEVLSNPELRERFDNGDDPMDPMAQQGGHPFFQGGAPFMFFQNGGGGGREFRSSGGGFKFQWGG